MKSLFSRFKAPPNGAQGGPRQSLDAGAREQDDQDATIRGVTRSRSILRGTTSSSGSATQSERATASTATDPPARDNTSGPSRSAPGIAARSVSERIRAFEQQQQQEHPPPPPPKDIPRASGTFRRASHKPQLSAASADVLDDRQSSLVLPDVQAEEHAAADWLQSPHEPHTADNVKKVMFKSPARSATARVTANSDRDRGRGPEARSGSPVQREPSPHRGSSPTRIRSITPTLPIHGHHRSGSRSSSRASGRLASSFARAIGTSGSAPISQSPTKSTTSVVAPSDASTASAKSYLELPESWSAAMDEELIANLGPRERARQEVLWEIVNSEEK